MNYLGDFAVDATVYTPFATRGSAGGRVEPSSAFEVADVRIYKNTLDTQRSSEAGYVMVSPFDSMVGVQWLSIDLSDNTDAGFYAAGNDYTVVLYPDETLSGESISVVLAQFSIENRFSNPTQINGVAIAASALAKSAATIISGTVDNTVAPTSTVFEADDITEATEGHFNGRIIIFISGNLQNQATEIEAYELNGANGKFTVTQMTEAPANDDEFIVI